MVAIIGGGIGGLTMAIALKKAGIPFKVYERSVEIKPVGAGIALASNAMQVYAYLEMANKLSREGVRIKKVALTNFLLKPLNVTDITPFEKIYKVENIAIHRSALHQVLLEEVGHEHIVLNKRLINVVKQVDGRYLIEFEDKTVQVASFIIGADGIRSKVRESVFGNHPLRDAKQICWRGVLKFKLPEEYAHTAFEGWGRGKRYGFVQLSDNEVYWYFLVNEKYYKEENDLACYLTDSHALLKELVAKTDKQSVFIDRIYDLKPMTNWHKDKVCLIGDAAHATTPNLGQGACQAIEDVYCISQLLKDHSLEVALEKYPKMRQVKAHSIVRDSWLLGRIAQFENPFLVAVRNKMFQVLPSFIKLKQMKVMFEL